MQFLHEHKITVNVHTQSHIISTTRYLVLLYIYNISFLVCASTQTTLQMDTVLALQMHYVMTRFHILSCFFLLGSPQISAVMGFLKDEGVGFPGNDVLPSSPGDKL